MKFLVFAFLDLCVWLFEKPWRFALLLAFFAVTQFRSWADLYVIHCHDEYFYAWVESVQRRR